MPKQIVVGLTLLGVGGHLIIACLPAGFLGNGCYCCKQYASGDGIAGADEEVSRLTGGGYISCSWFGNLDPWADRDRADGERLVSLGRRLHNILSLDEAKRGMKLLKEAGMKKLNFAGGEPFLYSMFMGELLRYKT
jgi:hypothetical protein